MTDFFQIRRVFRKGRQMATSVLKHPTVVSSLLLAGLVCGVRQMGGLEAWELLAYDQMLRLRPEAGVDPRFLVVEISEADIRTQNRWPLSDQVVAKLLAKLQQQQPRVIGLDIYRDIPQPPGRSELLQQLQAPNVVTVMLLEDGISGVLSPPGVSLDRVGFSDFLVDGDAVVRRNLLFAKSHTQAHYSFALQLSRHYLGQENLALAVKPDFLLLGNTQFPRLSANAGGYHAIDQRGYQILLNYRTSQVARRVTLTQMLNGSVDPTWIKNKIVLIGTTAPSAKDLFLTPYNLTSEEAPKTPGVVVHAQMTSQILGTVLDGKPLIWFWSEPAELLWILGWSLVGGSLAWRTRYPLVLGMVILAGSGSVFGICLGLFFLAGWVPFVPAVLGLVGTAVSAIAYRALYDAFHDALTGLPNRALFTQKLQWASTHRAVTPYWLAKLNYPFHKDEAPAIAVLLLGLDSFKTINDSFGHRVGDQLLVAMTKRLQTCLRPTDQLARVGGDEFAILRRDVQDPDEVTFLADQLQRQVTQPFKLNERELFATASIGIVIDRSDSKHQPEEILRDAHTALNRAKAAGKSRHEVFVTGMRLQVMTRLQLETDLRRAVQRQEFQLRYQPIICLETGRIAGFEALVRWLHPERGFVAPSEFIPIAEETDLIIPLGRWILREACEQLRVWQDCFPKDPPLLVSVNLSGKQFSQHDLVEQVEQALSDTRLDGQSLKLEITESMAMTDVEATIALLQRLKALDLQLSIDDFGTGYSSLSYLHRFPTSTLKVDRSFVSRMGFESEDAHIVQTIIILGHNLGMDIVAEGVETAEQLSRLRALRCEYGQGYFFAQPLSAEAAEALLKADPQW
jgi:diguanylate cyclase (GGDEF)-like protein